jgi:60 kDa SS-A/Ro ribonucleoprotein
MANKTLFASFRNALTPQADTVNSENAPAYALDPKQALAQYAATRYFGRTFYATAEEQLSRVLELCEALGAQGDLNFVAQVAIYSRTQSFMKDMPALLCAWLSSRDACLHEKVFARVVDNTRMLRNYVQILRSGVVGRKSLGSAPKRLVREWLAGRDEESLFSSSVGQNPSLADILKMVHPKPGNARREAFYGYMLGRAHEANELPKMVLQFEQFKAGEVTEVPELPFTMLSALPLSEKDWTEIARNASWQTTRMNLNTFARQRVFADEDLVRTVADRLKDATEIAKARVFPYQLLAAHRNCDATVPQLVKDALQDAMELAIANVPIIEGSVAVCPDVSGSMSSRNRPPHGVDHERSVHRCCRSDCSGGVAEEPVGCRAAVRTGGRSAAAEFTRQRDDERRSSGIDRRRRNELQCGGKPSQQREGKGGSGDIRVG